jgi:fatty acid desaturase
MTPSHNTPDVDGSDVGRIANPSYERLAGDGSAVQTTPTFGVPDYGPPPADMPIPNRLNLVLVALVFSCGVALLWLGSQAGPWYLVVLVGVVFSYLMLTNYALLHEAAHGNLHSGARVNYLLGVVTGLLFPIPFRLMRTTHQNHHHHNRTDHEMFDLYYPSDNRVLKWSQWYCLLCGLFWPLVPLGAVIFALFPGLLRWQVFKKADPARGVAIVANLERAAIRAMRLELLLIVAFFCCLFWLFDLRWLNTLILYACFSFNWSTRQYVGHAFSRRDVVEGAWNLCHYPWMSWLLLHGEWDLNHHRRPDVPWYYLPCLSLPDEPRMAYWKQYWRQWLGPRPCQEAEPTKSR